MTEKERIEKAKETLEEDKKLIEKIRAGDRKAARFLNETQVPKRLSQIRSFGVSKEDATDLVQKVMISVIARIRRKDFVLEHSLNAYFGRATVNKLLNFIRDNKNRLNRLGQLLVSKALGPGSHPPEQGDVALWKDVYGFYHHEGINLHRINLHVGLLCPREFEGKELLKALRRIAPVERELWYLVHLDGLSYKDIGLTICKEFYQPVFLPRWVKKLIGKLSTRNGEIKKILNDTSSRKSYEFDPEWVDFGKKMMASEEWKKSENN